MSAPTTTDDAARAEHKRLFDAQVQKRMSGVKEKSQFLTQATQERDPNLHANLELFGAQGQEDRIPWRPRLQLGQKVRGRHIG